MVFSCLVNPLFLAVLFGGRSPSSFSRGCGEKRRKHSKKGERREKEGFFYPCQGQLWPVCEKRGRCTYRESGGIRKNSLPCSRQCQLSTGNGMEIKLRTFCDARETVDRSRKIFTNAVRFFFSQVPDRQDQLSAEGETGERPFLKKLEKLN